MDGAFRWSLRIFWFAILVLAVLGVAWAALAVTRGNQPRPLDRDLPTHAALSMAASDWRAAPPAFRPSVSASTAPVFMCVAVRPVAFAEQPSTFSQEFEPWNPTATFAGR